MKPLYIFLLFLSQAAAVEQTSGLTQHSGVMTARVGETVTLNCSHTSDVVTYLYWYQQRLGGKPDTVSTRMKHDPEATVASAFKDRFKVDSEEGANNLIIHNLQLSDSATYYCGILGFNTVELGDGVFLHVKSSLSKPVIYQPALERPRVGGSVNLSCTVYSEPCEGEQSFYWFRHGAAQPAAMYHSKGQCRTDPESYNKRNCTLNLAIKSVSVSDVGVYYCALASCGETVFGNGTKVQIEGNFSRLLPLVCGLSVALAVSIIVLLILALIIYKLKNELCSGCEGTVASGSATSDAHQSEDADSLHYAALSVNRSSERHHPKGSMKTACVYSSVKSRKM
ncbi:uncharacterized protein LOC141784279 [Halichoeres trimaculatus]|uniref:uncharacterized protein LOC141784279 n=1 Tax=Halichoeres trimaculatus TaxID=147232 RepID=UPI003D9F08A7